ncbi:MAG: DUF3187 family protein [Planctomycetota bacterium]
MRAAKVGGWVLISGMAAWSGCVSKPRLQGPLPVRNQHPAQLMVLHLDPAGAAVLPAGQTSWRADLAYTSLFLNGSNPQGAWFMDGEVLRAALDAKVGLGEGLQLGLQLPFAHTSGGFLDDFIIDYHDLFGFPDQNRSTSPKDEFVVNASQGATTVWSKQESGAELLDVPVHLAWQLQPPGDERLGLTLRGGFELPTGDQDAGYGNGEVDFAFGVVAEYRRAGIGYSMTAQHTFAGTPRPSRDVGFAWQDVTSIGGAIELPLSQDLAAIVQAEWETSTLRELGPRVASREQLLLWVGGRWNPTPDWAVEIGFGEDLIGLASPDFTAWLAFQWTPGIGSRAAGGRRRPR